MPLNIIKGRQPHPIKGILYGVAGIGKTTFAAKFPKPLFLDVERGSYELEVDRLCPDTFVEVLAIVADLTRDAQGYQTLVIDTADWLEQMIVRQICRDENISGIEKYEKGYGKGWKRVAEVWGQFLDALDRLRIQQKVNVLFCAHSKISRFEPADDSAYDRYTLVMSNPSADVLIKWADLMLFVKYDVFTVENDDKKRKISGTGKRIMCTQHAPAYDAKNRYDLPAQMDFDFAGIARIFSSEPKPEAPAPAASAPAASAPAAVSPTIDPGSEQGQALAEIDSLLKTSGYGYGELTREIEIAGIVPAGTPLSAYNLATLRRIVKGWSAICHNIEIHKKQN